MWPLHVMASAEWTVADLVAAAVALYVKEGRRPLLPSADPAAVGLHYSSSAWRVRSLNLQFSSGSRYVLMHAILVGVALFISALVWLN